MCVRNTKCAQCFAIVDRSLLSPLMSITSLFGSFGSESTLDLDGIENEFGSLKRSINPYPYYHDRNIMLSFY